MASTGKGALVNKLREGLQDAVVFLRTLGDFKIPAVIERRRKELLERLTLLQGDTIKETPPSFEPVEDTKLEPSPTKDHKEKAHDDKDGNISSSTSSTVTSPSHGQGQIQRRDSKVVVNRIKDYESIHYSAKQEEEKETPKRLVTLKKVAKPQDFPNKSPEPEEPKEEAAKEEVKEEEKEEPKEAEKEVETEKPEVDGSEEKEGSLMSEDGVLDDDDDKGKKKKNKKRGFGGGLMAKALRKREKSPVPERKHPSAATPAEEEEEEPPAPEKEETKEAEPEVLEEGVKIRGTLERRKKGIGGTKKVRTEAKVVETTLILEGKEDLPLANCSVEGTDIGFDLNHPQHKSTMVFKVEGGEEERQKWVAVLKEAIAEATPAIEEEKQKDEEADGDSPQHGGEVPSITVDAVPSKSSNKRESKAMGSGTMKPPEKRLLPDQGVVMKGYLHRKKPGLGRSWEKTYCMLTYQAMYFTTMEDKKEYSSMLPIYPDSEGKLSETKKGKGHDKHCQVPGLALKLGKKMEQFSLETQAEFREWKEAIERVLGIGGVEELLSEDEEEMEAAIDPGEDLYEELEPDYIPPVPESPRPARPSLPQVPADDDIMIDEDIYEETDDILPTMPSPVKSITSSLSTAPTLPDRNPTKKHTTSPPPSLPPRGAAAPLPSLPPRNPTKPPTPQDYEATKKPPAMGAKPPAPAPVGGGDDEELYDDVVVGGGDSAEVEETYDDVVIADNGGGADADEELYDDVLTATTGQEPIQDEYYEDMAPGQVDSYVTMEKKDEEPDELYVDVDEPVSHSPSLPRKPSPKQKSSGTFSRMFQKKTTPDHKSGKALSGTISYKAPKKSKFEEKWGVIEGSQLVIYKTSSDRRSQEKITLNECRLELGSTEAGAGRFAFNLSKDNKTYHFSLKEAPDLESWVGVVKGLVKYAPIEVPAGSSGSGSFIADEDHVVYQAKEDHIAESDGELTFKRGTFIRLMSKESPALWVGQIGTPEQVFEGKIGRFPSDKVEEAEELYAN